MSLKIAVNTQFGIDQTVYLLCFINVILRPYIQVLGNVCSKYSLYSNIRAAELSPGVIYLFLNSNWGEYLENYKYNLNIVQ